MPILLDVLTAALLALLGLSPETTSCTTDPLTGVTVCVCEAPERWAP